MQRNEGMAILAELCSMMKISIVGSGNVAHVLGRLAIGAGHQITTVYSRNLENARLLAQILGSEATDSLEKVPTDQDLVLICLTDSATTHLSNKWQASEALVAHTAGSVSRSVLNGISPNNGIFYPLQSLRREMMPTQPVPLLVDASNTEALQTLTHLAQTMSPMVQQAGDELRKKLHVGAVMVNNFSNYLYGQAYQFCQKENADFDLLYPLIVETAMRLKGIDPKSVQTGPAARKDTETIKKHLGLLKAHPQLAQLYRQFSEAILQQPL